MKKLLLILLCLPLLFSTCKKEDEEPIINNTSNIEQIIVDKIWKGRVPDYQNNNDIIFELSSNDSLYIYTSGCTLIKTNIGTWNISGKIITYDQVVNSIEYIGISFGELSEYNETQLKFKIDTNINAICEIYNLSQSCTYIPDDNFEQRLIQLGCDNIMDNYVLTSNIDILTSLHLAERDIYDLTGIEDFTALTNLNCGDNPLTSLDVSQNTALIELFCHNNQLTSLDISQNTALTSLLCSSNQLTSLDVSQNTALTTLSCYDNQLQSLDVSANLALNFLLCDNNQLTSLDVRNGNNANFYNFITRYNPNLTCISVDDPAWSSANWGWGDIDPQHYFSEDCSAK